MVIDRGLVPQYYICYESREIGSFLLPIFKESDLSGHLFRAVQIQGQAPKPHIGQQLRFFYGRHDLRQSGDGALRHLDSGAYPKFSGCVIGMQWFQQRGLWLDGSAEPVPGMLIFFDWATQDGVPDHVGIVERVENNVVYTVEGNSRDMCRQKQYSLGSSVILV